MEVAAKRNARPPKQSLHGKNSKRKIRQRSGCVLISCTLSLRSELFSALHTRHLTGDRNDAQRHFLAFVFFLKTVKKMVCFPSVLKCLKLLKSENLLCEHKHKCAHTGNGGNCEPFSVCTRFSGCYLALKRNIGSIRQEQKPPEKFETAGLV